MTSVGWIIVTLLSQSGTGAKAVDPQNNFRFFGQTFHGDRIMFLISASPAVRRHSKPILDELANSISELKREQRFNILIGAGEQIDDEYRLCVRANARKPANADSQAKARVAAWLEARWSGWNGEPAAIDASVLVARALQDDRPDAIVLISADDISETCAETIVRLATQQAQSPIPVHCFTVPASNEKTPISSSQNLGLITKNTRGSSHNTVRALDGATQLEPDGPKKNAATIFGLEHVGASFTFVVDFSGSMTTAIDEIKTGLIQSISALESHQKFNVIVFYSDNSGEHNKLITESFEPNLVRASPESIRKFRTWLNRRSARGVSEPLAAMRLALSMRPDAVFFFSDGFLDDNELANVIKANEDQKTVVHCLVFDELLLSDRSSTPNLTDGARRMQRLAEKCRGKVKIVTGNDLGKK